SPPRASPPFLSLTVPRPPTATPFPYTTLFDLPPAEREQVLGRGASSLYVLHRHVVDRAVEDALAEQHERVRDFEPRGIIRSECERAKQQPVGELAARAVEHLELTPAVAARLLDENDDVALVRRGDDLVGELGEVGEAQLRYGETDRPGATGAQGTRRAIGPVVELLDRRKNPRARRLAHVRVVVDDVRNRLERDARDAGDVAQGRAHVCTLARGTQHPTAFTEREHPGDARIALA